jgi:hypothetical protein
MFRLPKSRAEAHGRQHPAAVRRSVEPFNRICRSFRSRQARPYEDGRRNEMSIFGNIMNKIFHHGSAATAPAASAPPSAASPSPAASPPQAAAPAQAAPAAGASNGVDVGAVLSEMASMKGGGGNYKSSIVDLLKLLDLDSSLAARKELAAELGVHAGADGSAEENIALHKAVMEKLAQNGGVVPDDMRH